MAKGMEQDSDRGEPIRRRGSAGVWTVGLAAVGIAAVWLGVFGIVRAYRFVEDDPRFCRTCHTMREAWDQWQTGEHREVTCHSCHEADFVGSLQQVWRYVTQQPDEVEHSAQVSTATCLSCHRLQERAANVASPDLHHLAAERSDCLLCHGQELHRFQTPAWSAICASCH